MFNHGDLTRRQRWMLYPVYGATAIVLLLAIILIAELNEMREFLGDKALSSAGCTEALIDTYPLILGPSA